MKRSGRWVLRLVLILWTLLFCLALSHVIETVHSVQAMLTALWVILDSLPQMLWWILGGAVLAIWTLEALVQLARQGLTSAKRRKVEQPPTGRLKEIQSIFDRTESSLYYWDETRALLRSLAIGLVALRQDISDEAAWQRLVRADRNEESSLRELFVEETDGRSERPAGGTMRNQSRSPILLDDIEKALDRLNTYGDFTRLERQT
jgi:hypothetical protein